jgi:phenylalanyl-tRNA synthetase beta subunit
VTELDIAGLYERIGKLTEASSERASQFRDLTHIVRDGFSKMATKDDIKIIANSLDDHLKSSAVLVDNYSGRIGKLETDRRVNRAVVAAAIGAPAFIVTIFELWHNFWGKS